MTKVEIEPGIGSAEWMREQFEKDRQQAVLVLAETKAKTYPYWNALSLTITAYLAGAIK